MTAPLDVRNDIRSMDARGGVPRAEIARRLRLSRNTVARYADMEDMSPEPPMPAHRARPAIDPHTGWIDDLLEVDLGAPRKQRHTAKRIHDRLVEERGYKGSYSSVRRHARRWRLDCAAGAGDGHLELEWAPGTAQATPEDNPFQMAEDLRRLRRENERLKRENEILLKASAFFASRQL